MKRLALALAVTILPTQSFAGAEGYWPPEARGVTLPRPAWVLVVPARRGADGTVAAWDRTGSWMRKWVVPRSAKGNLRTVAVTGDSEDARIVDGTQIDNMDTSALGRLASKYGAPAVAVVMEGAEGEAAVAVWKPGHGAAWDMTNPGEDSREGSLRLIGDLFSGQRKPRFQITGVRTVGGVEQYRLSAGDASLLDRLGEIPGIEVVEILEGDENRPSAVVTVTDGRRIEDALGGMVAR